MARSGEVRRAARRCAVSLGGVLLAASCSKSSPPDASPHAPPGDAAKPVAPLATSPPAIPAAAPRATEPPRVTPAALPPDLDAGASACKPLRPAYVAPGFIAPVVLRLAGGAAAELVFNDGGVPRIVPAPLASDAGADAAMRTRSTLPSCAAAGAALYCPDASGAIHAWRGDAHTVVAHARAGTDIAAAAVGDHGALAYLAERTTTEGLVREAWIVLDDRPPLRLSEEGSGATFVDLAPRRGSELLAMTIDARVAMTPVHARPISLQEGSLALGADAVVFVGGSAERHNAGALVTSRSGAAFALTAVADGADAFGMAAIRIDDPPREDEPVAWSVYPNGLDPAPIAAAQDGPRMIVARVRPRTADPKAPRLLELGELGDKGDYAPLCLIDEAPFVKDVEVALDREGALWVFYRDPRGSVLERRALPPRR